MFYFVSAQNYYNRYNPYDTRSRKDEIPIENETISWCTVNKHEQKKCENFVQAVERDKIKSGHVHFKLECKQVNTCNNT